MFRALSRWFVTASNDSARREASEHVVVESYPPLAFARRRAWPSRLGDWLVASSWRTPTATLSSFARRARRKAVAAARLDFADALHDIHTVGAADALDRMAVVRSLHELWYLRAEVFGRVAERHDQAEAARRLAVLDRHFPQRTRRAPARSTSAGANRPEKGLRRQPALEPGCGSAPR
jgi:hypothetical protein